MLRYPHTAASCLAPGSIQLPRQHLLAISLLALCCSLSASLPWHGAQVTAFVGDERYTQNLIPRITPAPAVLSKRQTPGPHTCGFIDSDIGIIPFPVTNYTF